MTLDECTVQALLASAAARRDGFDFTADALLVVARGFACDALNAELDRSLASPSRPAPAFEGDQECSR
jgi:hypothetical protein